MKKELKKYIGLLEGESRFLFIKDIKLQEVLYLFLGYVFFTYHEEVKNKNYCDEVKEMKAHTIFVYLGSIIEAVVYYFVLNKLQDEKSKRKYLEIEEFKKLQKIKETDDLYICKLVKKEISLNDSINFYSLINGLKDKKLLDKSIISKIDEFRKMRNLIHINAFLNYKEYELIELLEKYFIITKEIFDFVEENI